MRVLLVTMYFPPAGGGGVARPLKLATHLPELGIETHVLAPDDPKWLHRDDELDIPPQAHVHRARYLGPRGRLPAEELHGLDGVDRVLRQAALFSRRLLLPDEFVSWALTAIPAARRIVRNEQIDVRIGVSSALPFGPRSRLRPSSPASLRREPTRSSRSRTRSRTRCGSSEPTALR